MLYDTCLKYTKVFKKLFFLLFIFVYFTNFLEAKELHPVSRDLPGINIITRQQWGADDRILLYNSEGHQSVLQKLQTNKEELEKLKKDNFELWLAKKEEIYIKNKSEEKKTALLLKNFENQFYIDFSIKNLNNKQLRRPRRYHDNKIAIVIHHTADYADINLMTDKDEKETMKSIYKYHSITRGWGDIGYNFVIGPSGKIYEGKSGGPGIIGAHTKYNNSFSLGISLMGNFNIVEPTTSQIKSLKKLITELAYKYNINPYNKVIFHRKHSEDKTKLEHLSDISIIGHKDAGWTACPGTNLYNKLGRIIEEVSQNLKNKPKKRTDTVKVGFQSNSQKAKQLFFSKEFASDYIQKLKKKYFIHHKQTTPTKLSIKTLTEADKVSKLIKLPVKVLLRELSLTKSSLNIQCQNECNIYINGKKLNTTLKTLKVLFGNNGDKVIWEFGKYKIPINSLEIADVSEGTIKITNYGRKSYFGINWNEFKGKLKIEKNTIFDKKKGNITKTVVINELNLNDYLHGIVETNDEEHFEKNKLMAVLSKNYMTYYLDKKNKHPNIPLGANYNAIDDPKYFQKYVGAGVDKTLKKWKLALKLTEGQFIYFDGGYGKFKTKKLAFTPYFNCSPGFTLDAIEKFGRTNLPYLSSRLDFARCSKFSGHGVGVSGKGANLLASKGLNYIDIIKYYYPGVNVE